MTATQKIKRSLASLPEGEVFDYGRFNMGEGENYALAKTLSRLANSGEIVRLEKGKYYKPRQTKFVAVRPQESQVLKAVTYKNNRRVGYLTGTALYNNLGLTTQVSNVLQIARNGRLPKKNILGYKIKFIDKNFKFKEQDIPLLQILDALSDIKEIPDSSVEKSIPILLDRLKSLSTEQLKRITKLALDYNPATRALLGALFELNFSEISINDLKKSLNPLSRYKLKIQETTLSNKSYWNIE